MTALPRTFPSAILAALLLALALNTLKANASAGQGTGDDRAGQRITLPRLPEEADDSPAEAERYFLKKRLAPGMTTYPVDRLLKAREHARKLPL